jgi:hypothetical protein
LIIWLIFFLFLQTKLSFGRLVPAVLFAIPVSIAAVSLRRVSTYLLLDFKVAKWAVSSLTHLCGNQAAFVFVPSVLEKKFLTGEF